MTVQELYDEIDAIQAIYPGSVTENAPLIYTLTIPDHSKLEIQLAFPVDYPDREPSIVQVVIHDSQRYTDARYIEETVTRVIQATFTTGMVCLFDVIGELENEFQKYQPVLSPEPTTLCPKLEQEQTEPKKKQNPEPHVDPRKGWIVSETISDRGSTFIAFARRATSVDEAKNYLDTLITDKKIARATHNISSWRIKGQNGVQFQDCDDDGETAAGGRLLHLLTMMGAWNVIVVVSRWFGGTHLGPDRFKHVNSAARDAVTQGDFVEKTKK